MHPFVAVLLGTITGVGGGTVQDMFLARVPTILRSDVYATAALLGAAVLLGAQARPVTHGGHIRGRHDLLRLARGERVAALEPAASQHVVRGVERRL